MTSRVAVKESVAMKKSFAIEGRCAIKRRIVAFAVLSTLVTLAGCQAAPETPAELHRCGDPRPQLCTHQYDPVCALRDTGIRCVTTPCPSSERRSYGNACAACSDADVIGYEAGTCS